MNVGVFSLYVLLYSLPYNIKHLDVTVVVIWHINRIELN